MAKAETAARAGGSTFGFLSHKVAGKVPVWVIAVIVVGGYYWYTRYGPGKSTGTAGVTGTDPAGNTGIIDPATGFVYGSPEDTSALAAQGGTQGPQGVQGPPGPPGPPGPVPKPPKPKPKPKKKPAWQAGGHPVIPPGGGSYHPPGWSPGGTPRATRSLSGTSRAGTSAPVLLPASDASRNDQWGGEAVSNLVSQGVPPDQASTAIQAHLNAQPLSPAMAANRDLAIDSIGPNPEVPAPAQAKAPMTAGSTRA